MTQIIVFGSGCAFGLLAFSRGLRWLLEHRQESTMAVLVGLMIGSLGKLWPLQMPTAETAQLEAKMRVMQYVSPADYPGSLTWLFGLACVALVATLVMEGIAKKAATH
jgi:putative membrane protein